MSSIKVKYNGDYIKMLKLKIHIKTSLGFTLIELMIVIVVISILATIAYPSYQQYIIRGKRAEARAALIDTAARLERYYSDNNQYSSIDNSLNNIYSATTKKTENDYYTISATISDPYQKYTLKATPTFTDKECHIFTYENNGKRGNKDSSGSAITTDKCWGK